MTMAEMRRLIGQRRLDAPGYVLLVVVVVVIAALCMLTSRFGVFRILAQPALRSDRRRLRPRKAARSQRVQIG